MSLCNVAAACKAVNIILGSKLVSEQKHLRPGGVRLITL